MIDIIQKPDITSHFSQSNCNQIFKLKEKILIKKSAGGRNVLMIEFHVFLLFFKEV